MNFELELRKIVGDRIKKIGSDFSQKKIADSIGVSKSRISEIIRGDSKYLSYYQLYKLNEDFNIDLNKFITGEPFQETKQMTQINNGNHNTNNVQVIDSQANEIEALKKTIEVQNKLIAMLEKQLNKEE